MDENIKFTIVVVRVVSVFILLISGCTYKPPQIYNFDKERTYNQSYDEIWQKAIEWFGSKGTPVKNLDKASGFISTEYKLSPDDFDHDRAHFLCDCGVPGSGGILMGTFQNVNGNFNIVVKRIDDQHTKVNINTFYKADLMVEGQLRNSVDCNSTGQLEKELMDYLGTQK